MPSDISIKTHQNQQLLQTDTCIIAGILNVTPDSFSDGGVYDRVDIAVERALQMQQQGAHIIDIGGESTRPGAEPVDEKQEIDRVVPVIESLSHVSDVLISVDSSKPVVMEAAIKAGASMVNDVNALQAEGAIEVCVKYGVPVCLMHKQGDSRTMQQKPDYKNVVEEVSEFLLQRTSSCIDGGIAKQHIILDPGFGFGKTLEHNLLLLKHIDRICSLDFPVMMGISRKSMLGQITGADVDHRLVPGIAASVIAYQKGVRIFRVHDVNETKEALLVCAAAGEV